MSVSIIYDSVAIANADFNRRVKPPRNEINPFGNQSRKKLRVVFNTVRRFPMILYYVFWKYKFNYDLVLIAVMMNGMSLEYVSPWEYLRLRDIDTKEPYENGDKYIDLKCNIDIVLAACTNNYLAFQFASPILRDNPEFVERIIDINGLALEFASETCRAIPNIIIKAVRNNAFAFRFASIEFKMILDNALFAVAIEPRVIAYVPIELRDNLELIEYVIEIDPYIGYYYASHKIQKMPIIMKRLISGMLDNISKMLEVIDSSWSNYNELWNLILSSNPSNIVYIFPSVLTKYGILRAFKLARKVEDKDLITIMMRRMPKRILFDRDILSKILYAEPTLMREMPYETRTNLYYVALVLSRVMNGLDYCEDIVSKKILLGNAMIRYIEEDKRKSMISIIEFCLCEAKNRINGKEKMNKYDRRRVIEYLLSPSFFKLSIKNLRRSW